MEVGYTEQLLTVTEIKEAAAFLVFGATLRRHLPAEWVDEFRDKAHFLAWKDDQKHNRHDGRNRPRKRVSFNLNYLGIDIQAIYAAFYDSDADEKFADALRLAGLDDKTTANLSALHSAAIANACSQAIDGLKHLLEVRQIVPQDAKWNQILGSRKGHYVRFGKNANRDLMSEYLNKV